MKDFRINSAPTLLTGVIGQLPRFNPISPEPSDEALATSYLGNPIYDNIILSGDDTELDGSELRIDNVLMYVSLQKVIVKTAINGRNGTVKEYIQADDYSIQINGFIVSPYPNEYPYDDVVLLQQFIDLNEQIKVSCEFLNRIFNVSTVVIESGTMYQEAGFRNRVPFVINCLSDEDIELQIGEDVTAD